MARVSSGKGKDEKNQILDSKVITVNKHKMIINTNLAIKCG